MTENSPPIAYVCFRRPEPPVGDIGQAVRRALGLPPDPADGEPGEVQSFPTAAGVVALLPARFPYPAKDLSDDLGQRAAWPAWRTEIAAWKSHVIVTIIGSATNLDMCRRKVATVLRVASILAGHADANAVGWSGNVLFHSAADFIDLTANAAIPTDVVVRTRWFQPDRSNPRRLGVKTRGLRFFGLPEIDHPATGEDAGTLNDRVLNLSTYLIENGSVLKDGDTISNDATPTMRIRQTMERSGEPTLIIEMIEQ